MVKIKKNLLGKKFNNWTVIKELPSRIKGQQRRSYWECLCECGKVKAVVSGSLLQNKSKSCGCLKRKRGYGESARTNIFANYRCKARRRNIDFNITEKEFDLFAQLPCFYCGRLPSNVAKHHKQYGEYVYNGLDRMDNSKGYIVGNLVPSCKNCNLAKRNLSVVDFLRLIKAVYEKHNLQTWK